MSELGNLLKSTREEQKKSMQDVVSVVGGVYSSFVISFGCAGAPSFGHSSAKSGHTTFS